MVNNFRPTQLLHHRPLRTNIDFAFGAPPPPGTRQGTCPSMARQMYYTGELYYTGEMYYTGGMYYTGRMYYMDEM